MIVKLSTTKVKLFSFLIVAISFYFYIIITFIFMCECSHSSEHSFFCFDLWTIQCTISNVAATARTLHANF
jgi:hypothetical protein